MNKVTTTIGVTAAALLLASLAYYNHSQPSQESSEPSSTTTLGQRISSALEPLKFSSEPQVFLEHKEAGYKASKPLVSMNGIEATDELLYPVFKASRYVTDKNEEHLNNIGKFKLKDGLAPNQIGNLISRFSFRNANYYEALMVAGEGYVRTIEDNVGSTIYHGINLNFQNKSTMNNLAIGVSEDKQLIDAYTKVAGVQTVQEIKQILTNHWLPPQQSLQFSSMLQTGFDAGLMNQFKRVGQASKRDTKQAQALFDGLEPNVQAATRYMVYKLGEGNFGKYKSFINALWDYSLTPIEQRTIEQRKSIAQMIAFKYTITQEKDGKKEKVIKEDTRASLLVQSMFISPQSFGYIIDEDVKPIYFDGVYKNITGKDKSFDDDKFSYPSDIRSQMEELQLLSKQGYKTSLEKNSYFALDELNKVQKDVEDWNKTGGVKTRYCIGTTTITCGR